MYVYLCMYGCISVSHTHTHTQHTHTHKHTHTHTHTQVILDEGYARNMLVEKINSGVLAG